MIKFITIFIFALWVTKLLGSPKTSFSEELILAFVCTFAFFIGNFLIRKMFKLLLF